jgi:hypothetical protein
MEKYYFEENLDTASLKFGSSLSNKLFLHG